MPSRGVPAFSSRYVLWAFAALVVYAAFRTLWPFATAIVLGAWSAHLTRPLFRRLGRALRGRQRAAAVLTALLVLAVAAPFALAVTTLLPAARSLLEEVRGASGGRGVLAAIVTNGSPSPTTGPGLVALAKEYGAGASKAITLVATASIEAIVGIFVFFVSFFAMLVDGERGYAWLERTAPLEPTVLRRLTDAFYQAGRGLLVGNGVTALAQGAVATVTYIALGVPRAPLLGLLSVAGALIPVTGPAIVWIPVAAGLALTGQPVKAGILVAIGLGVVGTIDNLIRPWIAKRAKVGLSTAVVLVSIFGGIAVFGAWGLLLGPLFVRMAVEALAILRERTVFRTAPSGTTTP